MFRQPRHWEQPLQRLVLEQCINSVAFLTNQRQMRNISESSPISFLFQVDNTLPGFAYDYVKGVLKKAEIHDKFDLCETLLRLGGSQDCEGIKLVIYTSILLFICLFFGMLKIFQKWINCLNSLICVNNVISCNFKRLLWYKLTDIISAWFIWVFFLPFWNNLEKSKN